MTATTNAGWYADPTAAETMRYWDGDQWTEHTTHATHTTSTTSVVSHPSKTFWTICAGGMAVVVGSFMPWAEAQGMLGRVSVGPSGGALFLLIALAGGAVWCA